MENEIKVVELFAGVGGFRILLSGSYYILKVDEIEYYEY